MKIALTGFLALLIATTAVKAQQAATAEFREEFKATDKWLVLPVKNRAPKKNIELWIDGEKVRWFDIELADGQPDWLAYLDISAWQGKDIELRVDKLDGASKAFHPIQQSNEDKNEGTLYAEKLRGQFHFSPKRGWTNDPNGLVYYNGEYHLFFQHNPYGVLWGNMHWGHAVSKDLIHWKELGEALYPDASGPMFSGGAVVDSNNTSGLGTTGKPPMVMFYTGAGTWEQHLAWSTDGRSFRKLDHAVVPRINKDNRDPKVIWHAPTKKWVMVVYVERDNGLHSMQILTSPDLKQWTPASIVKGGTGDDRYLFECPEFFELPVEGSPNEKKWILTAANSQYAVGTFDGQTFTPEEERLNGQLGRDYYAAQTISNEPHHRRIEIGWWRTHTNKDGMSFNQSQSIPMELKLVRTAQGLRLTRTPVKELAALRSKTYPVSKHTLKEGGADPLAHIKAGPAEIHMEVEPGKATAITLDIHGLPVVYNTGKQELQIDGVHAPAPLVNGKLSLVIYADRIGVEVFSADGLLFMPVNVNIDKDNHSFALSAKGGEATLNKMTIYELKSIW